MEFDENQPKMNNQIRQKREFKDLCLKAMNCRWCFNNCNVEASTIKIAQPRNVGKNYWLTKKKVVIVMLNPGSGDSRTDDGDLKTLKLLLKAKRNNGDLEAYFQDQIINQMPAWGKCRFLPFYTGKLGLEFDEIAFANVAWCGTRGNKYPQTMLNKCFKEHTLPLLKVHLRPNVVILSGSKAHKFEKEIIAAIPTLNGKILKIPHFANRSSTEWKMSELQRAKKRLKHI